ncbi:MAG: hypothetical protein LBR08_13655 [Bacteroidales bacterium]|nr:hypothetical protein [Bacteroidales bacterium]
MDQCEKGTFGYDLNFLSRKDSIHLLTDETGRAMVIVSAKYQAKVFTSTAAGLQGTSLGFVNYKALDAAEPDPHMNGYGGENRFWLGPEGGRFSIYFATGDRQVYDNWHTPPPIDTEQWDIVSAGRKSISMKKEMEVSNYLGNRLKLRASRDISLIERYRITEELGISLSPETDAVAYQTVNTIVNLNDFEWTGETGAVCIWMLDMFNTAPEAVTVIPFHEGDEALLGKTVTSDYFGEIPADRLKTAGNHIYLKTDGKYRSKLGLNAKRTTARAGNYDPDAKRLTVIVYETDRDAVYLNQEWDPAKDPLIGDAMNAYNDGPLEDGSIMGPFLELESVSPAAFLKPMQTLSHKHAVYHFIGEAAALNPVAEKVLGVSIDNITKIFGK